MHKYKKAGQEMVPAPYMKACSRFCYHGCGLFLPQKDEVQSYTEQNAGNDSPGKVSKQNQERRDKGENQDHCKDGQYLAKIIALIHVKHCYTSSSVRV